MDSEIRNAVIRDFNQEVKLRGEDAAFDWLVAKSKEIFPCFDAKLAALREIRTQLVRTNGSGRFNTVFFVAVLHAVSDATGKLPPFGVASRRNAGFFETLQIYMNWAESLEPPK